jgi:hypothetical protein
MLSNGMPSRSTGGTHYFQRPFQGGTQFFSTNFGFSQTVINQNGVVRETRTEYSSHQTTSPPVSRLQTGAQLTGAGKPGQ